MVGLEISRNTNAALVTAQPLTAVFVGGTSGIGEYTIQSLAAIAGQSGQDIRLYLVGRNEVAASKIIADCLIKCPKGDFRFIKSRDLALLRDVDECCDKITKQENEDSTDRHARIDILVMSHADLYFGKRRETKEGLDMTMSMLYYSRMRFIVRLLPLLRSSSLPAHVISVFGAGLEKPKNWNLGDLSLRQPGNYNMSAASANVTMMKTFFMEALARQNAGHIALTHVFPSLVITPAFDNPSLPLPFKILWPVIGTLAKYLYAVSPAETGERMLFLASARFPAQGSEDQKTTTKQGSQGLDIAMSTNGTLGGGAYSCKHTGETNQVDSVYKPLREQGFDSEVWGHTMAVFDSIEANGVFSG